MVECNVQEGLFSCLLKWKPVSDLMVPPMTVSEGGVSDQEGKRALWGWKGTLTQQRVRLTLSIRVLGKWVLIEET